MTKTNHPCQTIRDLVSSRPEKARDLPEELASHAKDCAACQLEIKASVRLLGMMENAGSGFSPHLSPEEVAKRAMREERKPAMPWNWLRPAAGFALVLALVLPGLYWLLRPVDKSPVSGKTALSTQTDTLVVRNVQIIHPDGRRSSGARVPETITTGPGERAQVVFEDDTTVWMNEESAMTLIKDGTRRIRLVRGEILADVVKQQNLPPFFVQTDIGEVRVVGTRFLVSAQSLATVVNVLRGQVEVTSAGEKADVKAGGEAVLREKYPPLVQAASNLGYAVEWTSDTPEKDSETSGFGTLRARRPGENQDTELALRLIDHAVDVKIQGRIVRTEIEEEFMNDSDHTMEGIYTFPMPPDAKIAGLDLVVDGKWEHGAIVERSRGDKIWAGVLRNAAPKAKKPQAVEYVWVPGPWDDPAILNWKKGSQFELKIFPIPKKGSRRVRIAYTQELSPIPGGYRYVLPLAAAVGNQVASELFRFQASIGGVSRVDRLRISPLKMEKRQENGTARLELEKKDFIPQGDLIIDIPDENPDRELRAWSFRHPEKPKDPAYAALTLKPRLPAFAASGAPQVLVVVDHSYSVQKTRLERAAELVRILAEELGDAPIHLAACNHRCREIPVHGKNPAELSGRLHDAIRKLEPAGSTSLSGTLEFIGKYRKKLTRPESLRVVYLGNGIPTVGETDAAELGKLAKKSLGTARLTTVALGGINDEVILRNLARHGNGSFLGLLPGSRVSALAWKVLQRQIGVPLTQARMVFPEGVEQLAPAIPDVFWPGEEYLVAMRVPADGLAGTVSLSGELDGIPWKREYQLRMEPASSAGNAFVPRIWAQGRIGDLESAGGEENIKEIVRLSTSYHVLSRHTSLLVLESPAMAKAFGVEDTRPSVEWSGQHQASEDEVVAPVDQMVGGRAEDISEGFASRKTLSAPPAPMASSPAFSLDMEGPMPMERARRRPPRRPMVRMKKQWYREASIVTRPDTAAADWTEVQKRKAALNELPESRDRKQALVRALIQANALDEARNQVKSWLEKDALDAEALLVLSEIELFEGQLEKAIDTLESAIDVAPGNEAAHSRMVIAYKAMNDFPMMCEHVLPRALLAPKNLENQVQAVLCTQNRERHFAALSKAQIARAEKQLAADPRSENMWENLMLDGNWEKNMQAHLVVVTPEGRVVSFLGGANRIKAQAVTSGSGSRLSTSMERRGRYQIFVVPPRGNTTRSRGSLKIHSYNSSRTLPFELGEKPVRVADVVVTSRFRLVPAPM